MIRYTVARLRRVTKRSADILLVTPIQIRDEWDALGDLAEVVRETAEETRAGLANVYAAFSDYGANERQRQWLYAWDGHLGALGHPLVAMTVGEALRAVG